VTDSSNGQVLQFDVAPANGTLTPKTPASVSTGGYRATYIAVDGTDAYVLDIGINQPEPSNYAISQFDVEPASGALTPKPDRDIALASDLAPLGIILAPSQGYPRSKGASPFRASLVPAYRACTTANDTHGAPLSSPSCTPPTLASDFLTVGTPDANDAAANSVGFVQLKTVVNPAPAPNDVAIDIGTTDVRCTLPPSTTCGNANSVAGPDYTGHLQAIETLQVSDQENGAVTVAAYDFKQTVPCAATADMSIGASCSVSTSANTLVPGLVMKGARATWQLGQVRLYDGGASGTAGASDATLFEDQGVFVP
jgi:hypothetical protein